MNDDRQFCTFLVDGMYFGVDVLKVQEVIRYQDMTRVPLAHAVIRGLINLRGQIVTAVDLRRRLGLEDRAEGALPMNVVVRTGEGAMSLLVDEIGDVVTVEPESFERTPETLTGVTRDLLLGVYKLKDRLLLIMDTEKAVGLAAAA
ncbi:MAG: chemotaxis protein CheW [Phycisphaeraceae bacterium]|jgi:purine-binding chemotaxis protein CheW|nr:chemotaxis protein CheW [Phycisphaeraceae bacterium]